MFNIWKAKVTAEVDAWSVYPTTLYDIVNKFGSDIVDFRVLRNGDRFINVDGGIEKATKDYTGYPRLILRPLRKTYVFKETGEVREPIYGEYYVLGGVVQRKEVMQHADRQILKLTIIEE